MSKTDFIRTPDSNQRVVDVNLAVTGAFKIPVFSDAPTIGDNNNEAGYVGYKAGKITYYDGTQWITINSVPSGGNTNQYLRGDNSWQTLNTTAVPEGTNLYYTEARFNNSLSGKTTSDIAEGTNLYYTQTRFNSAFAAKSTTNLAEGTNLYYTNSRVQSFSDNRYLQLSGGLLTGDVQQSVNPVNANSLVTKSYVDNYIQGQVWKHSAKVLVMNNITLSGLQTINTVALQDGDYALVNGQTDATQNGLYIVHAGAWTRSPDADTGDELVTAAVLIGKGDNQNPNTQWVNSNTSIVLGVTPINFNKVAGAGVYTNGTGISLIGNVFSLDVTYADARYVTTTSGDAKYFNKNGDTLLATDGTGYYGMKLQGTRPATPPTGTLYMYYTSNGLSWLTPNGYQRSFLGTGLTADRVYTLPDNTGTLALLTDIPQAARNSVSATGSISYNSGTGVFSYTQPTLVSTFTNDAGYQTTVAADVKYVALTGSISTGMQTIYASGEQFRIGANSTNYASQTVDGSGNLTITTTGSAITYLKSATFSVGVNTATSTGTANLFVFGGSNMGTASASNLLFGGATALNVRAVFMGGLSSAATVNANYANIIIGSAPVNVAASGTHAWFVNQVINPVGAIGGTGGAVTNTASLYINGASSFAGSTNYALYVVSGLSFFGGAISSNGTYKNLNQAVYTSSQTITSNMEYLRYNTGGGAINQPLPTAVGRQGQVYVLKKIDSSTNALTISTTSSQTIDNASTWVLATQNKYVMVISNGANWEVIANN